MVCSLNLRRIYLKDQSLKIGYLRSQFIREKRLNYYHFPRSARRGIFVETSRSHVSTTLYARWARKACAWSLFVGTLAR